MVLDRGFAYESGGSVYFDVSKDADYGKLCNRDPEQMEAGALSAKWTDRANPLDKFVELMNAGAAVDTMLDAVHIHPALGEARHPSFSTEGSAPVLGLDLWGDLPR